MKYTANLSFDSRSQYVKFIIDNFYNTNIINQLNYFDEDIIIDAICIPIKGFYQEKSQIGKFNEFLSGLNYNYDTVELCYGLLLRSYCFIEDLKLGWVFDLAKSKQELEIIIDKIFEFNIDYISDFASHDEYSVVKYFTKQQLEKFVMHDTKFLYLVQKPSEDLLNFILN